MDAGMRCQSARTSRVALSLPSLMLLLASACSVPQRGATASNIGQAQSVAPDGSSTFQSYCAECHGSRGAGAGEHPEIVGDRALSNYGTALDLYHYVEAHMPKLGKAELAPEDYWTVVAFVVVANGKPVPEGGLSASNAGQVMLHSK